MNPSPSWPPEGAELLVEGVVLGDAKTAGSKVSGVARKKNAAGAWEPVRREDGSLKTFTKEDDKSGGKAAWRSDVRDAVVAALRDDLRFPAYPPPFDGPVALELVVYRARPKSHYGSGRNERVLKASAPANPTSSSGSTGGDVSKLVRAFEDAINKLAWTDDGRVCRLLAEKRFVDRFEGTPRAEFRIFAIADVVGVEVADGQASLSDSLV